MYKKLVCQSDRDSRKVIQMEGQGTSKWIDVTGGQEKEDNPIKHRKDKVWIHNEKKIFRECLVKAKWAIITHFSLCS